MAAPAYKVDDRSLLLPYYKRWLVDPLLPLLPAKLNPNTITHVGHLANLAGVVLLIAVWPSRGWPFAAAAALLHFYMWCDNADGAHARRTNQCSPLGEFLDHGLDQLNTVYIGYLTALALGASPTWWVVITLLIPGAACMTYWEQQQTGVFRLGLLNQVESLTVLGIALCASAILGVNEFKSISLFGLPVGLACCLWSGSTILFGMARGIVRVAGHSGARAVGPIVPLLFFGATIFGAARVGAISTIEAVTLATCLNVFFGTRMLTRRLQGEPARIEVAPMIGGAALALIIAWTALGHAVSASLGTALAATGCVCFGLLAANDAKKSVQHLTRGAEPSRGSPA
jgi:phosphatidylglycerophosphate synthase